MYNGIEMVPGDSHSIDGGTEKKPAAMASSKTNAHTEHTELLESNESLSFFLENRYEPPQASCAYICNINLPELKIGSVGQGEQESESTETQAADSDIQLPA